jgi:asparagine synthase (glutamine-hydrolysing)
MLRQDFVMYLPDDILTKVDRMSMAHGLEARVPLLDRRLIEFAFTLPFHLKLRRGVSKYLVKRALESVLPPEVLRQRKRGFAVPIHRWFREALRVPFVERVLGPDARCREYLSGRAIEALFQAHLARRDDFGHHLWALLMFEHWLRYAEPIPWNH